ADFARCKEKGRARGACGAGQRPYPDQMRILEHILSDRGSKYTVSGGPCGSEAEAKAFLKALCRNKKFARAKLNSWALLTDTAALTNADGEAGAGMVIWRA
ncbi:hypothetical protein EV658_14220, partial [Phaeovulum veldkampii DSM 11550]